MVPWLGVHDPFPAVEQALGSPDGLLAAGADLSSSRLIDAYSRGIFPWFSEGDPVLWWSPDPRMVLFVDEFRVSRSLRRTLRATVVAPAGGVSVGLGHEGFAVTADRWFEGVIRGCAEPRTGHDGTWITEEMVQAYLRLAEIDVAHSVEVWSAGALVGGVYGVALGRMFFGESMFSRVSDASKVALAVLVRRLAAWDFELIDCQMATSHLASLGAREIPRAGFLEKVARLTGVPGLAGPWHLDPLVENL